MQTLEQQRESRDQATIISQVFDANAIEPPLAFSSGNTGTHSGVSSGGGGSSGVGDSDILVYW